MLVVIVRGEVVIDGLLGEELADGCENGVALLAGGEDGGVSVEDAREVLEALSQRWPAVVLRTQPSARRPAASVAVAPLLPASAGALPAVPSILQRTGLSPQRQPEGVILPPPRRATVKSLLNGRQPSQDRWLRKLRTVWSDA